MTAGRERLREALTYVEEQHALHRQGKLGPTGYSSALSTAEAALRAALSGSSDPEAVGPHAVIVDRTPHTAEPCYGQCHRAVQAAVGRWASGSSDPHPLVVKDGIGTCQTCGAQGRVGSSDPEDDYEAWARAPHDCSGPPDWDCPQCDAAAALTEANPETPASRPADCQHGPNSDVHAKPEPPARPHDRRACWTCNPPSAADYE